MLRRKKRKERAKSELEEREGRGKAGSVGGAECNRDGGRRSEKGGNEEDEK